MIKKIFSPEKDKVKTWIVKEDVMYIHIGIDVSYYEYLPNIRVYGFFNNGAISFKAQFLNYFISLTYWK